MTTRRAFADMPAAQQAGILCNDPRFRQFAAHRSGFPGCEFSPEAAAEWLRRQCGIPSRRHLTHNLTAATRFQAIRTEFDAWTGKIATPR
jgi:hypothetical protein